MTTVVNTLAVILLSIIVLAFEFGGMAPANAFFAAAFVLVSFTSIHLMRFEGRSVGDAIKSVFLPNGRSVLSYSYLSFVGVAAVSFLIAVQAVAVA